MKNFKWIMNKSWIFKSFFLPSFFLHISIINKFYFSFNIMHFILLTVNVTGSDTHSTAVYPTSMRYRHSASCVTFRLAVHTYTSRMNVSIPPVNSASYQQNRSFFDLRVCMRVSMITDERIRSFPGGEVPSTDNYLSHRALVSVVRCNGTRYTHRTTLYSS